MAITPLPTNTPSRDRPATFAAEAADFLGRLPNFALEANSLASQVNAAFDATMQAAAAALEASNTAVNLPGTGGSSTTSIALALGSKTIITQTGKFWRAGQYVSVAYTANPVNFYMRGTVISYNETTGELVVGVDEFYGTGTYASWSIALGVKAQGAPSRVFVSGPGTVNCLDGVEYILLGSATLALPTAGTIYWNDLSNSKTVVISRQDTGQRIESLLENMVLDLARSSGAISYINTAKGWCLQ